MGDATDFRSERRRCGGAASNETHGPKGAAGRVGPWGARQWVGLGADMADVEEAHRPKAKGPARRNVGSTVSLRLLVSATC